MDYLTGKFVDAICQYTPVENGHAHAAWLEGAEQAENQLLRSRHIRRAIETHFGKSSEDPQAVKGGKGKATANKGALRVVIENRLPFVYKMEHGIDITVGDRKGNKGFKEGGKSTQGELYAPRLSSPDGTREGWLFWNDNGRMRFTKVRHAAPTAAFANAIQVVKNAAKRYTESQEKV